MWAAILAVIQAIAAYLRYQFDPEMVKRRDEINKKAALDGGLDGISEIFANKDNLRLSFFLSEFLRRKTESNRTPGWAADLQSRKLPEQRNKEDREADTQEGFDDR